MRSPARSVFGRVALVVAGAGIVSLTLSTLGVTWVVVDDQEATLVESAIRRAEGARDAVEHRLALTRSELQAVALSADAGSVLDAPGLVSGTVLAVRCTRGDVELLEATSTPEAHDALLAAPRTTAGAVRLLGKDRVVVSVRVRDIDAAALQDVAPAIAAPRGWSIRLGAADGATSDAAAVVATRFEDRAGEELVRVVAPTRDGLVVTLTAPLAPARTAAFAMTRWVLIFSSLAVVPLLLLAFFGARAVTAPVVALAQAVRRAKGDRLSLPPLPPDEIGDLGNAIGTMSTRLHDHAQALGAAVTFARHLNGHAEPDAVLGSLEHGLCEALPHCRWSVVGAERIAAGDVPADLGVTAQELAEVLETGTNVTREGRVLMGLCEATAGYGVVVGSGDGLDDAAVRHAELLARTAVGALRRLELLRGAVTNEKLLVVGRLAAGVAHEMNNPLAFVLANLRTLEQKLLGDDRETLAETRQGAERLVRIVRDLSSMSKGGTALELEELDLAELGRFAARVASSRRQGVEILVDAPSAVWVKGDRGRLEQVLLNLIVNAVDATRDRPAPRVEVRVRAEGGQALADVLDNGSGIPAGTRGKLFSAFFTTKGSAGTGLGLYLSRSFAEAHGGELEIMETGAKGTHFCLRVPALVGRVTPPVGPARPSTPAPPSRVRALPQVLIVDDEPAIVRGMKRWIGGRANVTGSTDPQEAVGIAAAGGFDLILCDLNMPVMQGTAFVEALRARDAGAASRVVIMTGGAPSSIAAPQRVVEKPIRPDVLQELLDVA